MVKKSNTATRNIRFLFKRRKFILFFDNKCKKLSKSYVIFLLNASVEQVLVAKFFYFNQHVEQDKMHENQYELFSNPQRGVEMRFFKPHFKMYLRIIAHRVNTRVA